MSKIGFKVQMIRRSMLADSSDHNFPPLIPLALAIKASIQNGIKFKSEDEESTESFLEQRSVKALHEYNKSSNGLLLRTLSNTHIESDDLMLVIRRRKSNWIKIRQTSKGHWGYRENRNIYRTYINLYQFGMIMMWVEAKTFNIGNNGSLTHILCCDISTTLVQEFLRTAQRPYPEDFNNLLQTAVVCKISQLEMPETLREQLVTTMEWMFWSEILVKPVLIRRQDTFYPYHAMVDAVE